MGGARFAIHELQQSHLLLESSILVFFVNHIVTMSYRCSEGAQLRSGVQFLKIQTVQNECYSAKDVLKLCRKRSIPLIDWLSCTLISHIHTGDHATRSENLLIFFSYYTIRLRVLMGWATSSPNGAQLPSAGPRYHIWAYLISGLHYNYVVESPKH